MTGEDPARAPLTGVAALADRPVDERRVARVMAAVAVALAAGCVAVTLTVSPEVDPLPRARGRAGVGAVSEARVSTADGLHARRRFTLPIALGLAVLALGPIKRAFGFDRATPLALIAWPGLLLLGARGLELAPSPALGLAIASVALALAFALGRGPRDRRLRRHGATVGWSAAAATAIPLGWSGLGVGPGAATAASLAAAAAPALVGCALLLVLASRAPSAPP